MRRTGPVLAVNAALATAIIATAAAGEPAGGHPPRAGHTTGPAEAPTVTAAETGVPAARGAVLPAGPGLADLTRTPEVPGPPVRPVPSVSPAGPSPAPSPPLENTGALSAPSPGVRLSVAVLETDTGRSAVFGEGKFDTASIVKVDILAALLLHAQDAGRELTEEEQALAAAMIRRSDNEATHALWAVIGREAGLDAANARLGLTGTRGGEGGHWGLTQTTSEDQLTLLRAVFPPAGTGSALSPESRAYIRRLMAGVVADQRWGVSAAGDGEVRLKNGWLPRSHTQLWDINSIGSVVAQGRRYLVAVVSDGHADYASGVAAVEAAAAAAVASFREGSEV